MDRTELFEAVKAYAHRTDLTDALLDLFLELTESTIAQSVRVQETTVFTTIDTEATAPVVGNSWALPDDYLQMIDVRFNSSGNRVVTVQAVGRDEISAASHGGGGGPAVYSVYDGVIELRPGPGGREVELIYFSRLVPLTSSAPDNDLLTAYPGLYLWGMLGEVWNWAQDADLLGQARAQYAGEVERTNLSGWNADFGTTPRGSSGYNYVGAGARQ